MEIEIAGTFIIMDDMPHLKRIREGMGLDEDLAASNPDP